MGNLKIRAIVFVITTVLIIFTLVYFNYISYITFFPDSELRFLFQLAVIFLVVVTTILLIMRNVIDKMTKPMKEFTLLAERVCKGDFNARITGDYTGEIALMKASTNLMVTRIKKNIEEDKEMRHVLNSMLNGIDAMLYVTVPQTGEILFINEKMKKIAGLKGDEGIGDYCYKRFRFNQDKMCEFCPCFELDKNPDKIITWEEYIPELNCDIRHTDCYIDWVGGVKVHLQYAVDITDLKQLTAEKILTQKEMQELAYRKEQAEKISRMKSVFFARVGHGIKTPMHGIISFIELALDDDISSKTRNFLSKIKANAERLLLTIDDIHDIARIEAGKIEIEKIPFNINDVFTYCNALASVKTQEKGLKLSCYCEPSDGKMLLGDPAKLRQILKRLLDNAIRFTYTGEIELLAAIYENTQSSTTIHFEVKDTGIGMTEEQMKSIYQPFVQIDDNITKEFGGMGLGLTISKTYVDLMGGKLEVESNLGAGSKFSFDLTFEKVVL